MFRSSEILVNTMIYSGLGGHFCDTKHRIMKAKNKADLLRTLEARVENHIATATDIFQNLPEQLLLQPAANGGWSIAQCLEHLNRYGDYYLPAIAQQLAAAGAKNPDTFRGSWLGSYFTRMMDPATGAKKVKAFKAYIPPPQLDAYAVVAAFLHQQEQLLRLLERGRDADLDGLKVPVSIARWIRLKLGDVFQFVIAHNERHMQQAVRNLG